MRWFVLFCLIGTSAVAETISTATIGKNIVSTKQMGDVAEHLVTKASCSDVTTAFVQATSSEASKRVRMMNIAFVTYAFGYAQGRSMSLSQALGELLARCDQFPELPFAGSSD